MHHQQNISKLLVTELSTKVGVLYLLFIFVSAVWLSYGHLWSHVMGTATIAWYYVLALFWPENHQEPGNEVRSFSTRECPVGFEQTISQFHCNALTHRAILLKILLKAVCLNRGMLFCWTVDECENKGITFVATVFLSLFYLFSLNKFVYVFVYWL